MLRLRSERQLLESGSVTRLQRPALARRVAAEAVGTALLLATVIGSGIMAERLSGGNVALALLTNSIATGGGLVALILTFGGISGAHFNPAITVADASQGGVAWRDVIPYILAQIGGAFVGVAFAHVMFEVPIVSASHHVRSGMGSSRASSRRPSASSRLSGDALAAGQR